MIVVHARFTTNDGAAEKFVGVFNKLRDGVITASDNVGYQLYRDARTPTTFLVVEQWRSRAALGDHLKSSHLRTVMPELAVCLSGAPEIQAFDTSGPVGINELLAGPPPDNNLLGHDS